MNKFEKSLLAVATVALFIIIIILPLRLEVFNESYYEYQFEKNGVYEKVSEADLVVDNLLGFFKGGKLSYFTDNEKSHLEDVRVLLNKSFLVLYYVTIIFVASLIGLFYIDKSKFKSRIFKILFLAGLSSFAFLILFFLASLNFTSTFEGFHLTFFPQGNYAFSSRSLLITLFSETFFKSFFLRIILDSFVLSLIFMIPQLVANKIKH